MKNISLILFIMLPLNSLSAQEIETFKQNSCCLNLQTLFYRSTTYFDRTWRNDYLYLANQNSSWYLKMKLAEEGSTDINRYYLRHKTFIINTEHREEYDREYNTEYPLYVTPLHEAITRGNLEIVRILLAAGANKDLTIKDFITRDEKASDEFHVHFYSTYFTENAIEKQKEIDNWKTSNHLGATALGLAQVLSEKGARRKIYKLLKKNE